MHARGFANVLEVDPELGEGLEPKRLSVAKQRCRAAIIRLPDGHWEEPSWSDEVRTGLGLLVLEGQLMREVGLDGRSGAELLTAGDLLRPWQREDAIASVPRRLGWQVLRPTRLAVLDIGFAIRIAEFPEIHAQIVGRALRRSRQLAVNMAIVHQRKVEDRLHMLLWHLADRWGTARPDGAFVPLTLTHAQLSQLVAARRPTVSAALMSLERSGKLTNESDGWLLHGSPPPVRTLP